MRDFRNKGLKKLKGYVPGEQPADTGWVKLNTNEFPYRPSPAVAKALAEFIKDIPVLRKYPHPFGEPLRSQIAAEFNVKPGEVFIANGSDEILSLLTRGFISNGGCAVFAEVTYSLYSVLVEAAGHRYITVPMKKTKTHPFRLDLKKLAAADADLLFLPNPNAPTGEFIPLDKVSQLCRDFRGLVVIDEAYNDFAAVEESSAVSLTAEHDNLVVSRTFSKSHGLAGLRAGYMISRNQKIMQGFYALKDSYNTDAISVKLAAAAFSDCEYCRHTLAAVIKERKRLSTALKKLHFHVLPSEANFVMASPPESGPNAAELLELLKKQKILIRYFNKPGIDSYVRISIGSEEENSRLLEALTGLYS